MDDRILPKLITLDEGNAVNGVSYLHTYPESSVRGAAQDIGISKSSIQRILENNGLHPYKLKLVPYFYPGLLKDDPII